MDRRFQIIVVGGGHAGVEAAWAAANLMGEQHRRDACATVALVTPDPAAIGVMSCNPAIGGLAKGQIVREIDALGGLMAIAADATGIQFRLLNTSKGPAVHGPRCQSDKVAYAEAVQAMIVSRHEIEVIAGRVERLCVEHGRITGVEVVLTNEPRVEASGTTAREHNPLAPTRGSLVRLDTRAVVLTTGTFMRGLMHTGNNTTPGGRTGEPPANTISDTLRDLGFELGRLKTGTPPRLARETIDWDSLPEQHGDEHPTPFSELMGNRQWAIGNGQEETNRQTNAQAKCFESESQISYLNSLPPDAQCPMPNAFPALPQVSCRQTHTTPESHELIRSNLHRAPMYDGRIESVGPRYCPSIEDKVVRFATRESHGVYLEPESLRTNRVYCNGISTSLPTDIQDAIVRMMPGCENAHILQYGYAVEYDMVRPHQIHASGMTKLLDGLFLAGQINGTSGYEEAAAQGLVTGVNAVRFIRGESPWILGRDEAYAGVLMDDLVTKTPVEPYRMFTSRAEHRLMLRSDNAPDRLTPVAHRLGLLDSTELGRTRWALYQRRCEQLAQINDAVVAARVGDRPLAQLARTNGFGWEALRDALPGLPAHNAIWKTAWAELRYAPYIERERVEIRRRSEHERRSLPGWIDYQSLDGLRNEARAALSRFRPETFGQASRLEGITPSDLTLLRVLVEREREKRYAEDAKKR